MTRFQQGFSLLFVKKFLAELTELARLRFNRPASIRLAGHHLELLATGGIIWRGSIAQVTPIAYSMGVVRTNHSPVSVCQDCRLRTLDGCLMSIL